MPETCRCLRDGREQAETLTVYQDFTVVTSREAMRPGLSEGNRQLSALSMFALAQSAAELQAAGGGKGAAAV